MEWNQTYGGPSDDTGRAVVQTADGGYALAGYTASYGAGDYDFWLVKTDSSGNALWNQTYGAGPQVEEGNLLIGFLGDDEARSVIQTDDGGFVLAGYTWSFGAGESDGWLIKTDSDGNMVWNQTYGGTSYDHFNQVISTSDGGFALAGGTPASGAVSGYNAWLMKTDSSGAVEWNQSYGAAPNVANTAEALSLIESSDGGLVLSGTINVNTVSHGGDYYLFKEEADLRRPH
jgi:hypothetical protein